jgi:hypothetical protein
MLGITYKGDLDFGTNWTLVSQPCERLKLFALQDDYPMKIGIYALDKIKSFTLQIVESDYDNYEDT